MTWEYMMTVKLPVALIRKMVKKSEELEALKQQARDLGASEGHIRGIIAKPFVR